MTSTRDEAPRTSAWGADARLASRGGGGGGGGGVEILPDISHIGMCRPKGNIFCAVLAWKSGMAFEKLRECMNVFIV